MPGMEKVEKEQQPVFGRLACKNMLICTQNKFPGYLCIYYLLFCPDKFATTQNFFISTNNLHC